MSKLLWVQACATLLLFTGSLAALAWCLYSIVGREQRGHQARILLESACRKLAAAGSSDLGELPTWPSPDLSESEWTNLETKLAEVSRKVAGSFPGVDAGYYSRFGRRFVGASVITEQPDKDEIVLWRQPSGSPPANEFDLVEMRSRASYKEKSNLFTVVDVPPNVLAVCTNPVWYNDQPVGAVWATKRLDRTGLLNSSTQGYIAYTTLSLGGILTSLVLTLNVASAVRKHTAASRRLERESRRNECLASMGRLLAQVAHELRNPLAVISSTAQLWNRGVQLDSESAQGLINEVDRMETIVSGLLDFFRFGGDELEPGDLNTVASESAKLGAIAAAPKGVSIETDLDPNLPKAPMAPKALMQVFRNLVTNAVQASPNSGVVKVSTRFNPKTNCVTASVEDEGEGLSPDALEHLFEPFFTTKPDGTGLGLAISREIALSHNGDLQATNRRHARGARFTLTLPIEQDGATRKIDSATDGAAPKPRM